MSNPWVRIAIVVVLALVLFWLIGRFGDDEPTGATGSEWAPPDAIHLADRPAPGDRVGAA